MGKHWSANSADQVRASVKEAIGKITGNTKLEVEGAVEKADVKAREVAAGAKAAGRDAPKK